MFRNYRVMSIVVILLVCAVIAGIVIFCLSNAKADKKKPSVSTTDSLSTPSKNIKVGVQAKDVASVQALNPTLIINDLAQKGMRMTPDEIAILEKKFEENPDDLDLAAQLLGFYTVRRLKDPVLRKKRDELIFSLIKNHPDAEIFKTSFTELIKDIDNCAEAQKLWAQQVENNPNSIPILMNAANSALHSDSSLTEKYLLQAQAIDPDNLEISKKLAQNYNLRRNFDKDADKSELATKELAELTKVYSNSDSKNQNAILPAMTKAALESPGNLDLADRNADLMISQARTAKEWDAGKLFYYGYYTKGMVAFKNGDTNKAVEFLLKSAETPASSTFDALNASGGPNMSLAKALLEAGYKDEVIEFLGKCGRFWKYSERGRLGKWTAEIKAGKTPDFGANLAF